ncbi:hypothetical protein Clacol_007124 [Clathrus columnatus]|uniref:Uncharacterized protein n=1 Tax=Clathrus columnatus TaxID=1419009 RepID=A0AAV5AID9_9AGAM|nr:hypothetical protein Clacol_007124 [Clathrus columnatus]
MSNETASIAPADLYVLLVVIRQYWSLWRERRILRVRTNADFVALVLQQGGFSLVKQYVFLRELIAICVCEFTLDLRRRNEKSSNQSTLDLSRLSFQDNPAQKTQSFLERFNENIVLEMGERNDFVAVDGPSPELEEGDRETP